MTGTKFTSVAIGNAPDGGALVAVNILPEYGAEPDPSAKLGLQLIELSATGETVRETPLVRADDETVAR